MEKELKNQLKNEAIMMAFRLGMMVIWEWINSDKDSSVIEDKLVNAETEEEIVSITVKEGNKVLGFAIDEEEATIIADLAKGDTQSAIETVMKSPKVKMNIFTGLMNCIRGLLAGIFGLKG